jgi:cytochrome c
MKKLFMLKLIHGDVKEELSCRLEQGCCILLSGETIPMKRTLYVATASIFFCASFMVGAAQQNSAQNSDQKAGDAAKGKDVFEQCSVCHNADTDEKKIGPSLKGLFKRDKLVNGKKVNEANVRDMINNGGNGMPAYADMLSKDDKDNVVAYLKTL